MSIELDNITSGFNLSKINDNFQKIEDELNDNVLRRNGLSTGETNHMNVNLDMNSFSILNVKVDPDDPKSLITVEEADARYYNVVGDTLEGLLDAGQYRITNLAAPLAPFDATRKQEVDSETSARQSADANIQEQLTGNVPLMASAFSEISWHSQEILNSVAIPVNKNAWSFGPQMEIEQGQAVTIGSGSSWTVASGRVVENEDLHALIADTITTSDNSVTKNVATLIDSSEFIPLENRMDVAEGDIDSLEARMTTEETKVQSIALGGTGNTTGLAASATVLATGRTFQTNLASTSATSFNGSVNVTPGVTGVLAIANGGTGQSTVAYLHALAGAATQPINQNTWTKLTPAASIDTLTSYAAGNYTVPSTGYYHLRAACRIPTAGAADTWALKFDVSTGASGSATQGQATKGSLSSEVIAQVDCILSLTTGATISAYAFQTSTTVTSFSDATISIIRVA